MATITSRNILFSSKAIGLVTLKLQETIPPNALIGSQDKAALACDPTSSFGGIVSCNFKIDKKLALELNKIFLEVIIANGFEKNALKILKSKKKY